jgi:hypothetical protein
VQEVRKVRGRSSAAFQAELGYSASEEVVFRGNTALLDAARDEAAAPGAVTEEDEEEWAPGSLRDGLMAGGLGEALRAEGRREGQGEGTRARPVPIIAGSDGVAGPGAGVR